jgi:hypothetical protein
VGTTFGYNNANSNGVNCLDSNGQTQACSTPPGWVIAPYSGGITGECNAAADCMLDGVTTAGGVPGEVWIKAALISGTP